MNGNLKTQATHKLKKNPGKYGYPYVLSSKDSERRILKEMHDAYYHRY